MPSNIKQCFRLFLAIIVVIFWSLFALLRLNGSSNSDIFKDQPLISNLFNRNQSLYVDSEIHLTATNKTRTKFEKTSPAIQGINTTQSSTVVPNVATQISEENKLPDNLKLKNETVYKYDTTNHSKRIETLLTEILNKSADSTTIDVASKKRHDILLWWSPGLFRDLFKRKENINGIMYDGECGSCRLTADRSYLTSSNVIIFDNFPSRRRRNDLPPKDTRRPDQAYVLWEREAPPKMMHMKRFMEGTFDKMFNYTMSYRRDADIIWYLGNAHMLALTLRLLSVENFEKTIDAIMDLKKHMAVWVVSNCGNTPGAIKRKIFAEKLIDAGLEVDLFGSCYQPLELYRNTFLNFLEQYKFYFAFENSWHCKDYLTEKFWRNGLSASVVPIIWGTSREDVAAIAPKYSYIHSEDFESPADLVKYLNYLNKNDTAYREYFNWRREPKTSLLSNLMIRRGFGGAMCKLCRVLTEYNGTLPYKVIPSSIDWVFAVEEENGCF